MLLTSELARLKDECGYNNLTISALPYTIDGVTQLFEQVVQPFMQGGTLTSCTTTVTASLNPANVTLVLGTNVGISVGDRLVVDQDIPQEYTHVQTVLGDGVTITCALQNAHSGSYPVCVEGGEAIVRQKLRECILIQQRISRAGGRAGVKKVDEIEFFAATTEQRGVVDELLGLQRYWRQELCDTLGVPNLRAAAAGQGQILENY